MKSLEAVEHRILYKDPFAYCAHPHVVNLRKDAWVVVFNRAPRRTFLLHPPLQKDCFSRNPRCCVYQTVRYSCCCARIPPIIFIKPVLTMMAILGVLWFKRRFGVIRLTCYSCPMNGFCVSMAIGVSRMAFELPSAGIRGRHGAMMKFCCFGTIFLTATLDIPARFCARTDRSSRFIMGRTRTALLVSWQVVIF